MKQEKVMENNTGFHVGLSPRPAGGTFDQHLRLRCCKGSLHQPIRIIVQLKLITKFIGAFLVPTWTSFCHDFARHKKA